jgi:hypothetical protein
LTDVAPGHVACFLWVNSLTSRVPFASVTGATRFLNIDAEAFVIPELDANPLSQYIAQG